VALTIRELWGFKIEALLYEIEAGEKKFGI
jgi:hypothetical protein